MWLTSSCLQTIVTNAQHFIIFYSCVVFEEFCLRYILYGQTGTDRPAKLTVTDSYSLRSSFRSRLLVSWLFIVIWRVRVPAGQSKQVSELTS